MNRLHLTSPVDHLKLTQKFGMTLLVKNLGKHIKSAFSFKRNMKMEEIHIDIGLNDMVLNYTVTKSLTMNGLVPWRGAREKDPRFFKLLINATTAIDVVLDCIASTDKHINWAAITACRATGRHILAFEEDIEVFSAVLKPMLHSTLEVVVIAAPPPIVASQDPDPFNVISRKFARKTKPSGED